MPGESRIQVSIRAAVIACVLPNREYQPVCAHGIKLFQKGVKIEASHDPVKVLGALRITLPAGHRQVVHHHPECATMHPLGA
jgi:hypothetical protein